MNSGARALRNVPTSSRPGRFFRVIISRIYPRTWGFYDLRLPEARAAQAELAAEYGIYGFCYYRYWFNGRQMLERPVNEILNGGTPDFPFCLCWANENWTRRWDGMNHEILLAQQYNADDDLSHIRSLIPFFLDRRYIRVMDRPFFAVYRASELPDPQRTADVSRREAERAGLKGLFLVRVVKSLRVTTNLAIPAKLVVTLLWNLSLTSRRWGFSGFSSEVVASPQTVAFLDGDDYWLPRKLERVA